MRRPDDGHTDLIAWWPMVVLCLALVTVAALMPHPPGVLSGQRFGGAATVAERLDDALYRPGTLARLEALAREALAEQAGIQSELEADTQQAAGLAVTAVDRFLDHYYSLGGEYARLATLVAGELDGYLADQFAKALAATGTQAALEDALHRYITRLQALNARYDDQVRQILSANALPLDPASAEVIRSTLVGTLTHLPLSRDVAMTVTRLGISLSAGTLARELAPRVVRRMLASDALKPALGRMHTALRQVAGKRATSLATRMLMGGAAGAAAGSAVPVLGNLAGLAVGLGAGLATDWALVRLDEIIHRDALRQALIDGTRRALGLPAHPAR